MSATNETQESSELHQLYMYHPQIKVKIMLERALRDMEMKLREQYNSCKLIFMHSWEMCGKNEL